MTITSGFQGDPELLQQPPAAGDAFGLVDLPRVAVDRAEVGLEGPHHLLVALARDQQLPHAGPAAQGALVLVKGLGVRGPELLR